MVRSRGFSLIEGIIVAGVVVLLVGVGYIGLKALTKSNQNTPVTTGATSSSQSAEVITSKADLESAEKELSGLSFDDDSSTEAEIQANL